MSGRMKYRAALWSFLKLTNFLNKQAQNLGAGWKKKSEKIKQTLLSLSHNIM